MNPTAKTRVIIIGAGAAGLGNKLIFLEIILFRVPLLLHFIVEDFDFY